MHTHVIRTTEGRLAETVDEWLGTGEPAGPMPVVLHKGSRDYLVIVRHPEHEPREHARHEPHGAVELPVVVGGYDANPTYSGWIEDEARTWVLYLDNDHRPSVLWLRRDTDGGVVGEPVAFSDVDGPAVRVLEASLQQWAAEGRLRTDTVRVEGEQVPFGAQYRTVYWVEPFAGDARVVGGVPQQ